MSFDAPMPTAGSSSDSGMPFQTSQSVPTTMKLPRGTSRALCQQRKVRCDKNKPCAICVKAGTRCHVVPGQLPRRRKKHTQDRDLLNLLRRLGKYEALLNENGVKFDSISHDLTDRLRTHEILLNAHGVKFDSRSQDPGGHHENDVDDLENDIES
jgi:hypothetical protein